MRIRHIKGAEEAVAADPFVIQDPASHAGRWKQDIFQNDAPLYLEVGMGMGSFIRQHSLLNPGISYLGFEINTTVLYKAMKRYEAELEAAGREVKPEASNLRFIRSDARFLGDYFDRGEVDRIYLNFSDPWPKDKNANKRLTSPVFLKLYDRILRQDGVIEFKTDNRGLFDYSTETLPANGWTIRQITYDLHHDPEMNEGNVMTEYEAKFSAKGNPIFKLIASR